MLTDPGYFTDPYPAYDRLRDEAPAFWSEYFDAWVRALVNRAFTPQVVDGLRPRISAQVHQLLDAVEGQGSMDLVADLAHPLPVTVISELVGIPVEDRRKYKAWSSQIFGFLGTGRPTETAVWVTF